jgi:hypothetical protein
MNTYIFSTKMLNSNFDRELKMRFILYASMQTPLNLHSYRNTMSVMLIPRFSSLFLVYRKTIHQCNFFLSSHELVTAQI